MSIWTSPSRSAHSPPLRALEREPRCRPGRRLTSPCFEWFAFTGFRSPVTVLRSLDDRRTASSVVRCERSAYREPATVNRQPSLLSARPGAPQCRDLHVRLAKLPQNLIGMLCEAGWWDTQRARGFAHMEQDVHGAKRSLRRMLPVRHRIDRFKLLHLEQVFQIIDAARRYIEIRTQLDPMVARVGAKDFLENADDLGAMPAANRVSGKLRVIEQVGASESLTEA